MVKSSVKSTKYWNMMIRHHVFCFLLLAIGYLLNAANSMVLCWRRLRLTVRDVISEYFSPVFCIFQTFALYLIPSI